MILDDDFESKVEAELARTAEWNRETLEAEITRLRQLLSEAEKRARREALEDAALRVEAKADSYQAEARDVRGSDRDRRFCASVANRLRGAASDIRALQSEDR